MERPAQVGSSILQLQLYPLTFHSASNFSPLQWIQQKFAPSVRKSAVPDAPKQETADLESAQQDVFVEAKGADVTTKEKEKKVTDASPGVVKKPPAREVRLLTLLRKFFAFEMTFGLSTNTPRRTLRSRTGNLI